MTLHEDKICAFLEACERAGIKNPAAFLASKRHMVYDWLKGAFPYGIIPTDIDGLVHLNGYFLLMEFKDEGVLRDGAIPKGQMRCFSNLRLTNRFTVFLIGMNRQDEPVLMQEMHHNGKKLVVEKIDRVIIQKRCQKWAAWAASQRDTGEVAV